MTNDNKTEARPPAPETTSANAWTDEYRRGGIPSSVREAPSGSVVTFLGHARAMGIADGNAIDIGCGGGRNSLYLAALGFHVTAFDFEPSSIGDLRARAEALGLALDAQCRNVVDPWPCPPGSQQLGIDAFCFKHQIALSDLRAYANNAATALAPGALMMVSFAGRRDGYYVRFPTDYQDGIGMIIRDPGNGILSRLYEPDEVAAQFDAFESVQCLSKHSSNEMHGARYDRETHILYLQRRL